MKVFSPKLRTTSSSVTGPHVDWCEDNKIETIRTNVLGTLTLAAIAASEGILPLLYGTDCSLLLLKFIHWCLDRFVLFLHTILSFLRSFTVWSQLLPLKTLDLHPLLDPNNRSNQPK